MQEQLPGRQEGDKEDSEALPGLALLSDKELQHNITDSGCQGYSGSEKLWPADEFHHLGAEPRVEDGHRPDAG